MTGTSSPEESLAQVRAEGQGQGEGKGALGWGRRAGNSSLLQMPVREEQHTGVPGGFTGTEAIRDAIWPA